MEDTPKVLDAWFAHHLAVRARPLTGHEVLMKEIWLAVIPATVPTLAVLVGILLNQQGINRLDARIDRLEARMDRLETRFNDAVLMLVNSPTT
jgi:hypothetical protein